MSKEQLHLDFLEIGTSDFNTYMETCNPTEKGMVIEPLKMYLDNLPNKENVIKVNSALLFGDHKTIPIFYIKPEIIKEYGLHEWMRGCNSVGSPHDLHIDYFETIEEIDIWHSHWKGPNTPKGRNLIDEGLVTVEEVPCISFKDLVKKYNIGSIKYIKIDTEGLDADIVHSIFDDLWVMDSMRIPEVIQFETNVHNDPYKSMDVINRLKNIGYDIQVGEANSNNWTPFVDMIYRDCKATIKPKWKNEY